MDDTNQQQPGSDAAPKDFDCGTSLKGAADEKTTEESPRKSSCDTSNTSDALVEALNTNGIDKEYESQASDNLNKGDLGSTQSQENIVQEGNTSNVNVNNESNVGHGAVCDGFGDSVIECKDKVDNEINSGGGGESYPDVGDSVKGDVSEDKEQKEESSSCVVKTVNIIKNQLNKSTENDKECNKEDLSEKSELCENATPTNTDQEISSEEKSEKKEEENTEKEESSSLAEKCNENKTTSCSEELTAEKGEDLPPVELENENETGTASEEETDATETISHIKEADNSQKVHESDTETLDEQSNTSSSQITQVANQQNEEKEEKSKGETKSTLPSTEEDCPEGKSEKSEDATNVSSCELNSEVENKETDKTRDEMQDEVENKTADTSILEEEHSKLEKKAIDACISEVEPEMKSKEIEENLSDTVPMEINSSTELMNSQGEERKDDDDEEQEEEETDECESSQKYLETHFVESEKENTSLEDKNKEGECSQVNRLSTSGDQEEEETTNKSENEGNEVMDTEMVNCNEIEQIDLSENESDLKGDGRDDEMVADSLETPGEKTHEDQITDGREDSGETEKSAMLIDEEGVNQPGGSEEETITGDTTNQSSMDLTKEKDEEICIIPDDVLPALSMLRQTKDAGAREGENGSVAVLKVTSSESVKPKTRAHDNKSQRSDSKSRPVRNAAKLAGNKIKSLVESDLVFDEQVSGDSESTNAFQENTNESAQMCAQCREVKVCKLVSVQNDVTQYLCSEQCSAAFKATQMDVESSETDNALRECYVRKCGQCHSEITIEENRLFWETVDFCNEDCLGKYQLEIGSNCANCKKSVPSVSLGKYCVRFGYDIRQFCSALCLEEYKKGLKVCSYCQKDISTGAEGFLAPVGNKGQFKDFCTQSCMEKYERMSSNKPLPEINEECAVCSNSKPVQLEVELDNKTHKLCSEPCFAAFKFVNNITEGQCDMCRKYFDRAKIPNYSLRLLFYDETLHSFCSKTCMNVYILANRKIVPCNWCKVKKYNFDMIKKVCSDGQLSMMCSLNCLMLYQTSVNAVCSRPIRCDFCKKKFVRQPLYHLTMSDATIRNFCSYNCVMSFQSGYPKKIDVISGPDQLGSPIPTGGPKRIAPKRTQVEPTCVPVISSVQSLASPNGPVSPTGRVPIPRGEVGMVSQPLQPSPIPAPPPQVYQQIITKPAPAKQMKNKSVLCKPYSHTKGVSCRPHPCVKETQTDQSLNRKFLIPIPVPIYVPAPMHMFATPFPVPVPFPLPIPVPIFIPTTRNSAKGIMKEIKKIQEKIPTDPFEAELLMMAEMVAGDKKQDPTDSESEDGNDGDDNGDGTFSPENVDTSNTFGDDMLQMALKMASELEEPAVDMESVLTSNTITTTTQPAVDPNKGLYDQVNVMAMNRGRKRSVRGSRSSAGGTPSKRGRRTSGSVEVPLLPPPEPVPPRTIEVEKPDANMCLKYTFGVNAWRHWVMQKNAELEKAALTNRKIKLFKPELLQLTADELNFSLCLFVKEVRKPNGTEYAPDTIYYLCLGIQQYLFENGRIDNIFTDSYYEKFTDCLDEVAKKFAALYNDSQYIVTRVEEEHLWESKQLGAHSPHVLLSTLMFFNTKHFNLVTVEEHMQLSFSHIMKHWKRNPNTPGVAKVPGSRNVLLRFYPPQSALEANSRKKKVYEQQENEENPLRCPVKLYEFYLSKCPESVKTRNDVFYLLPERSCVPDSPVWYSTMALGKEPLMKMLHRIKMVKEINIALLTS